VIAEQGVHPATGTRSLALEAAKQIQRASRIVTTIHHIAGLHEHCPPPAPAFAAVYETGGPQDRHESIVRTVNVTNRDNPFFGCDGARIGGVLGASRGRGKAGRDTGRGQKTLPSVHL
jgi:hypothetical protein